MAGMETIRDYYNAEVDTEWARIEGRPEFLITCHYLSQYIKKGDRVLDIGGGPGRYSLWLAERGCDVTLLDLSPENVRFAKAKAEEQGLSILTVECDARTADTAIEGPFDHVLLMGPLYHLLKESDRVQAVNASLQLLKPGGVFFASFINMYSGIIYATKFAPEIILDKSDNSLAYLQAVLDDKSFAGTAFTQAFFIHARDVLPFMAQFSLEKLHFFGQESMLSPCENNVMTQSKEVVDAWLDMAVKLSEREELISWSEHLMYIGRKH